MKNSLVRFTIMAVMVAAILAALSGQSADAQSTVNDACWLVTASAGPVHIHCQLVALYPAFWQPGESVGECLLADGSVFEFHYVLPAPYEDCGWQTVIRPLVAPVADVVVRGWSTWDTRPDAYWPYGSFVADRIRLER